MILSVHFPIFPSLHSQTQTLPRLASIFPSPLSPSSPSALVSAPQIAVTFILTLSALSSSPLPHRQIQPRTTQLSSSTNTLHSSDLRAQLPHISRPSPPTAQSQATHAQREELSFLRPAEPRTASPSRRRHADLHRHLQVRIRISSSPFSFLVICSDRSFKIALSFSVFFRFCCVLLGAWAVFFFMCLYITTCNCLLDSRSAGVTFYRSSHTYLPNERTHERTNCRHRPYVTPRHTTPRHSPRPPKCNCPRLSPSSLLRPASGLYEYVVGTFSPLGRNLPLEPLYPVSPAYTNARINPTHLHLHPPRFSPQSSLSQHRRPRRRHCLDGLTLDATRLTFRSSPNLKSLAARRRWTRLSRRNHRRRRSLVLTSVRTRCVEGRSVGWSTRCVLFSLSFCLLVCFLCPSPRSARSFLSLPCLSRRHSLCAACCPLPYPAPRYSFSRWERER